MAKRRANGEGSIFQRKDGLWAAQYTDNIGKKRTLYGKTQKIVKDKLKEAIRQTDTGVSIDKNKVTFAEWLLEWLEIYSKPNIKKSSYADYHRYITKHIIPAFPKILLNDLRTDMLQRFFVEKSKSGRLDKRIDAETGKLITKEGGLSNSVLNVIKAIIVSALNQAVDNEMIMTNVAKKVRIHPAHAKERKILSLEEQKRLEDVLLNSNDQKAFAVYLALYTGLRIGELLALKVGDIDFDKSELRVRRSLKRVQMIGTGKSEIIVSEPKTQKGIRTIPLPEFVMDKLKEYINTSLEDRKKLRELKYDKVEKSNDLPQDEFIFVGRKGGACDPSHVQKTFRVFLKLAEIDHINFHALRHTFATRCLEVGFDIKSLSDILGHTDAKMTLNTYVHALTEQKKDNMSKLGTLFL